MSPTQENKQLRYSGNLSFKPLIRVFEERVNGAGPGHRVYSFLLDEIRKIPALNSAIEDYSLLTDNRELVEEMINSLFPVTKNNNDDLFAVIAPYSGELVYTSKAFGEKFPIDEKGQFHMPGSNDPWDWDNEKRAGAFQQVLRQLYQVDIPGEVCIVRSYSDEETGLDRYLEMNVDTGFIDVCAKTEVPELPSAFREANYRFEDLINDPSVMDWLDLSQFAFDGFATVEIRDVTEREVLDRIRNSLLDLQSFSDVERLQSLQKELENLLSRSGITIGITPLFRLNDKLVFTDIYNSSSIVIKTNASQDDIIAVVHNLESVFGVSRQPILVPSIDEETIQMYSFLRGIKEQSFCGVIMIPLFNEGQFAGTMEIAMNGEGHFDTEVLQRVMPAVPLFERAVQNISDKLDAQMDKVIKEQFTAVQPSVEWKFNEAALSFVTALQQDEHAKVPVITFDNVYPMYGAIDIRNSSTERNKAIQEDLLEQLKMAASIIRKARKLSEYPLLREVNYKIRKYANSITNIVLSDEEIIINRFLKSEVVKLLRHLENIQPELKEDIENYFQQVTTPVDMLYKHRKDFDESITAINLAVSKFIDAEQLEAQKLYPHFFERFVTDGVDFNIYVGQSINPDHPFDKFYLKNIKIWQLSTLAKAAQLSHEMESTVPMPLKTTQLILAHGNPISISFRPAERKFDVDGAYNIRYEIIKKRIDKVCIRDTDERLTKPGTIAIVYSTEQEAREYEQYIEFLQHEKLLNGELERMDLEELQGVGGLKALRIGVQLSDEAASKTSKKPEKTEA
ncbi:MAG TPA: hypothetical protein VLC28_06505 [Flavitalea sp.]|nr:hypothetical protein [Flavitalea sp.]